MCSTCTASDSHCGVVDSKRQDTISACSFASVAGSLPPSLAGVRYGEFRSILQQNPSYHSAGANITSTDAFLRAPFLGERYDGEDDIVRSFIRVNVG